MHAELEKLKQRLQQVVSKSISPSELVELVHLCRGITLAHLESHRRSITQVCLQHGLTLTDLSYDCLAEAFARSGDGSFWQIVNFAHALRSPLQELPGDEVFIAFRAFLVCIADAQLARLYAQADPVGARIHRNLRDNLKRSTVLKLDRDFRGLLLRPSCADPLDHLPPFPIERLENELSECVGLDVTIPAILSLLHDVLCSQSEYRRSIPLLDIVLLVKKTIGGRYEKLVDESELPSCEGLSDTDIEQLRAAVEIAVNEKILLTYFARGKVDRRQAEGMASALHDLLWDWCSGNDGKTLYEYLCLYLPMSRPEYENTLRTKMEYLVRIAREEFAARLLKEL